MLQPDDGRFGRSTQNCNQYLGVVHRTSNKLLRDSLTGKADHIIIGMAATPAHIMPMFGVRVFAAGNIVASFLLSLGVFMVFFLFRSLWLFMLFLLLLPGRGKDRRRQERREGKGSARREEGKEERSEGKGSARREEGKEERSEGSKEGGEGWKEGRRDRRGE